MAGEPKQQIEGHAEVSSVAVLGRDYHGLKPTLLVQVGDRVKLGQALFIDKMNPEVFYTAPASGTVSAIYRGPRRSFQSIVIACENTETTHFPTFSVSQLAKLKRENIVKQLADSGLWSAFRTRPHSKNPPIHSQPHAIFVTAMDSNPLAVDPSLVIREYQEDFLHGLHIIRQLTAGHVYVCQKPEANIPVIDHDRLSLVSFGGPHPAGLTGTHIHLMDPVNASKTVWHIGYQDLIAIGQLFTRGQIWSQRIIALAGTMMKNPRLVTTNLGANIQQLIKDEIQPGDCRIISGSVLSGHHAAGWANYLGRYHSQVCAIAESKERELFGWLIPSRQKFSFLRVLLSTFDKNKKFPFSTAQQGSPRAIVPIGNYEAVMPLDILATPLLKALVVGDTDTAQALGCLELDEEDLALCTFVCSGKHEFGAFLRESLIQIEKEG